MSLLTDQLNASLLRKSYFLLFFKEIYKEFTSITRDILQANRHVLKAIKQLFCFHQLFKAFCVILTCRLHARVPQHVVSLYSVEKIRGAEMSNVTSVERVASAPRSGGPSRDAPANPCYTAQPCQELGETTGNGLLLPELQSNRLQRTPGYNGSLLKSTPNQNGKCFSDTKRQPSRYLGIISTNSHSVLARFWYGMPIFQFHPIN